MTYRSFSKTSDMMMETLGSNNAKGYHMGAWDRLLERQMIGLQKHQKRGLDRKTR